MYNYNDIEFLDPKFSSLSSTIKKVDAFVRDSFDGSNFSQLPAIKEEDAASNEEESEINSKSINDEQSLTFPALNINCLMNIDVKQSHSIWNTNFGKRLINENSVYEVLSEPNIKETSFIKKRTKFVQDQNEKNRKENKKDLSGKEIFRKKQKNFERKLLTKENKSLTKKESDLDNKSLVTFSGTSSTEKSLEISPTVLVEKSSASNTSKSQFLSNLVKSIFENNSDKSKCEYCKETFSNAEILWNHEKQHVLEKKTCLLCEKVFYNSSKFAQHLFTHEGVDRFSCKKCMTYFPNLRRYKQHVQEVHYVPPPTLTYIYPPKLESVEKSLPTFECKRCKEKLDSAETYKAHKRAHLRKDLKRAYLLSLKNM